MITPSPFVRGLVGSAADERTNAYVTPFDVGWGALVNFDHQFPGKEALQNIAAKPPRCAVTLEWDADSVSAAFSSRLRGTSTIAADPIESAGFTLSDFASGAMRLDHVVVNGARIGVTAGRTIDYDSNRMVSLAFLDTDHSQLGTEVSILWGDAEANRVDVRARVAPMPYYRGEFRNETFIPGPVQ